MAGALALVAASVGNTAFGAAAPAARMGGAVASVELHGDQWVLRRGVLVGTAAAYGSLSNGTVGGWSTLDIAANLRGANGNATLAYAAAGRLEAALSCWHIGTFAKNNDDPKTGEKSPRVASFIGDSMTWIRGQVASNRSDYWTQVGNSLAQFDGLVEGYQQYCSGTPGYTALTPNQMLYMQMDGDLEDLNSAFMAHRPEATAPGNRTFNDGLRCSMLAKLSDDKQDMFFAHATWDSFSNMSPRIYKIYHLPVVRKGTQAVHTVSFSSSPSWLASIDDWYMTNGTSSLVVIETSHEIQNSQLYKKLSPQTVFCWLRVVVANALAADGAEWAAIFSAYHSGTYNNEWQVIDLHKFTPGANPSPGLLTIVEEIPGLIHAEDMTSTMVAMGGYWPSFNVPYFPDIQRAAGYQPSDWTDDPRHCLLKGLQSSVQSTATMEAAIRHNNFKVDKCSHDDPCTGAISCRADLELPSQMFGGLDGKWSSWTDVMQGGFTAIAELGPTHDNQKVFCWSSHPMSFDPHHGHPDCFDFVPVKISPSPDVPVPSLS
mmetsp:Transcript_29011/g.87081  ORF Transcript_29011/g.87081 Transcript_29011/m.87081 type:complete len:544 (-) Transcript_29011:156-1787(-)